MVGGALIDRVLQQFKSNKYVVKTMEEASAIVDKATKLLSKLKDLAGDAKIALFLIKDVCAKKYQAPWTDVALLSGAFLYLITTFDVMVDILPIGFIDDIIVMRYVLDKTKPTLDAYKQWKQTH
jgi:uncharacterized membrane protein YkvA (DUF1232 family)